MNVLHVCGDGGWARGLWDRQRIQSPFACLSGAIASLFMVACRQAGRLISALNGAACDSRGGEKKCKGSVSLAARRRRWRRRKRRGRGEGRGRGRGEGAEQKQPRRTRRCVQRQIRQTEARWEGGPGRIFSAVKGSGRGVYWHSTGALRGKEGVGSFFGGRIETRDEAKRQRLRLVRVKRSLSLPPPFPFPHFDPPPPESPHRRPRTKRLKVRVCAHGRRLSQRAFRGHAG